MSAATKPIERKPTVRDPTVRNQAKAKEGPRAAVQRERILVAARQCFIDKGFHGASMALIADTAGMSPGLMYRYFPSKNAIVLEIIQHQLERSRLRIQQLQGADEVTTKLIEFLQRGREGDSDAMHGALFLETSAEGSRDPQIGEALQVSDRQTRNELLSWFTAVTPQQSRQLTLRPECPSSDAICESWPASVGACGLTLRKPGCSYQ